MMSYMEAQLPEQNIGLLGSGDSMSRFFKSLNYIAENDGRTLLDLSNKHRDPHGRFVFIDGIWCRNPNSIILKSTYKGYVVEGYRVFGQIVILTLRAE